MQLLLYLVPTAAVSAAAVSASLSVLLLHVDIFVLY